LAEKHTISHPNPFKPGVGVFALRVYCRYFGQSSYSTESLSDYAGLFATFINAVKPLWASNGILVYIGIVINGMFFIIQ
jgi:hypothetical protein